MASAGHASGGRDGLMARLSGGDPLFGNKVSGAVLATLMFAVGLNIAGGIIFTPKKPAVPGYDLPAPEAEASSGVSDQQAQAEPLPVRLASADPAKGQAAAKKCLACHAFEKGGPNKIGPGLYGVVGNAKGTHAGFNYSAAMKGKGGEWSFDDLDTFLANPKGFVPGTIMAFAGVPNPKERADLLRYMQGLDDSPTPLPQPAAATTPAAPAAPPGPSQTQQQTPPPTPGQRVDPGPAAIPAQPQPATPQSSTSAGTSKGDTDRPAAPAGVQPPQEPAKPQ